MLGLPPTLDFRHVLMTNRCDDTQSFTTVLIRPLPFKIPLMNQRTVMRYQNLCQFGEAEYKSCIDTWIECFGGSPTSETTVVANDVLWQKALQVLCNLTVFLNEKDPSSQIRLRPDFTAFFQKVLIMKTESKINISELPIAIDELIEKFHPSAQMLFPRNCPEIPGIVTSSQGASIHRIYFANTFHQECVKSYQFLTESGRVDFICDIFKLATWIVSQTQSIGEFHIPPNVRMKTRNKHHITLLKDGLVKEFYHDCDITAVLAHIKTTYEARLPNVEQGTVNSTSITITTIGRRLSDAIRLHITDKTSALEAVTLAVQQLHSIGMAHCDICVDNVFVSIETGVVFLGDLEYCRPMISAPPVNIRRACLTASTAQELDNIQLRKLQEELVLL